MVPDEDAVVIHPGEENSGSSSVVKEVSGSGVATHEISFRGLAGTIFICLLVGTMLCLIAFVGNGWSTSPQADVTVKIGLWESCQCSSGFKPDIKKASFEAVQAMITIGLLGFLSTMVCVSLYMCACLTCIRKSIVILFVLGSCVFTVIFMFIGIVVYAAEMPPDHSAGWAIYVSAISTLLACTAGGLTFLQFRRSKSM